MANCIGCKIRKCDHVLGSDNCLKARAKARKARIACHGRLARDEAYRTLGLTKVKGALGGVYWE